VTEIFFYHGANNRVQAAADWLRKAWEQHQAVLVYAPDDATGNQLDRILWTQTPTGFLPHCRADSPLAGETPIVIASDFNTLPTLPQDERLLNLADEVPPGFARFQSVVEIVSNEDSVRIPARERFKFYRERGYEIQSKDLGGTV
jgi:DNA polymerase-3 subunit chi